MKVAFKNIRGSDCFGGFYWVTVVMKLAESPVKPMGLRPWMAEAALRHGWRMGGNPRLYIGDEVSFINGNTEKPEKQSDPLALESSYSVTSIMQLCPFQRVSLTSYRALGFSPLIIPSIGFRQ